MKSILKSLYQNSRNKEIKGLIFDAFNEDYRIRSFVARNSSTPINILERLSKDENWIVRYYVAFNPNTPISVLEKLSNDEYEYVCYLVTKNPNWINKNIKK